MNTTRQQQGVNANDVTLWVDPEIFAWCLWFGIRNSYLSYRDEAQQKRQEIQMESRDEILVKIGDLEGRKKILLALQTEEPSAELSKEFSVLEASLDISNARLSKFANDTEELRQKCLISRIRAKHTNSSLETKDCQQYASATGEAFDTVSDNTELYASVHDIDYQVNSYQLTREALNETAIAIDDEIKALKQRLAKTDIKFSHLARDAKHVADSQEQLDSKWLSFSFDSKKDTSSSFSAASAKSSHVAASFRASGTFWSARGSVSHSRSRKESSFSATMNSAHTLVSGQLLRVTIQRPWFRPSVFKSKQFQIKVLNYIIVTSQCPVALGNTSLM